MTFHRYAATLLIAALVLATPAAQAPPPSAQAPTVDQIVGKNMEAKGGVDALKATTSVRTIGKAQFQGAEVAVTRSTKRPHFMLNEMEMAGQKMVQGYDGDTIWVAMPGMPAQSLPPGPQADVLKQSSQIDSPLLDYKAKGTTIDLGEPATHDGRKQHHLIVKPKTGPTMHYYIDAETNLESRMAIDVEDGPQKMKMEMRFSDFKTVEGRTIPFTVTQFVNGEQVGQMKFEKIEFNVALDDAMFRMPK